MRAPAQTVGRMHWLTLQGRSSRLAVIPHVLPSLWLLVRLEPRHQARVFHEGVVSVLVRVYLPFHTLDNCVKGLDTELISVECGH